MNNKGLYIFIGLGFELAALVIGALIIGEKLDKQFGLNGLGSAGLLMVCFFSWVFHFVVLLKRFQAQLEDESGPEQDNNIK
ncbi:MAG: hypothetical protein R2827_01895 [Bdellovibrionales bacterium]